MYVFTRELRASVSDDHRKMMDVIESNLEAWVDRHTRYERLAYSAAAEIRGSGHQSAEALIKSQATNIASRLVGLLEAFIEDANEARVHAAPAVVRAIHETCCVPCYIARELIPRLQKGNSKSVNDVYRILYRLGMGVGPGVGYGKVRAIPVSSLNKAAAAWQIAYLEEHGAALDEATQKVVSMIYAPLSDRTHPNHGATAPGMTHNEYGEPVYTLRPRFDRDSIDELLSATFFMVITAGEAMDELVAITQKHPTPFPPGEPDWQPGDLLAPGEESVLDKLS
jgi:hypothetical protein